jgi:hypothetical protein
MRLSNLTEAPEPTSLAVAPSSRISKSWKTTTTLKFHRQLLNQEYHITTIPRPSQERRTLFHHRHGA